MWGAEGSGCTRQTRVALPAGMGQNRSQLVWTGAGGSRVGGLSAAKCILSPTNYIYLYTENSRCACVCIYGMCVYIYLYAVYIKIYTYMDLF